MKNFNFKKNLPYIIIALIGLITLKVEINSGHYKDDNKIIVWDVIDYYGYLPATFIYHDYTLKFMDNYKGPHKFVIWNATAPNGGRVIMTSMGLAMMYSPFFFIAHWYASSTNTYDAGGYSPPYRLAIMISNLFFTILGLFFMAKLLLKYFNPYLTTFVILCILFGTNLFYYVAHEPGLAHAYNFSLITIFIYLTIGWFEKPGIGKTVLIGLIFGLISLIRPVNVIVGLFFILWSVKNFNDLKERFLFLLKKWWLIALMFVLCMLVWTPQLLYWKSITGHFWYYSYGRERFFFNHPPHIIDGLFSYRKGWLVYSPIMIFSLIGIPLLWLKKKEYFFPVLITLVVFLYVVFSWWCWWYGGTFGMRVMIDLLGMLAIPLGFILAEASKLKKLWKYSIYGLSGLLLFLGVFHMEKYLHQSIHYDGMTKEAFWDSYFRISPTVEYWHKLNHYDYELAKKGVYVIEKY